MAILNYTISINAPVATVRDKMLNHPHYEQRTTVFAEGSTYEGSREQGSRITFIDPKSGCGMFAEIAENRLHEFVSIRHLGEIVKNEQTGQKEDRAFPSTSHENYTFTPTTDGTQIDVVLDAVPEERAEWMNEARPKALTVLKTICEQQ